MKLPIENKNESLRKPAWLKTELASGKNFQSVKQIIQNKKLDTICQSGKCPNLGDCWGRGTATFMILGNICSRNCSFCSVTHSKPTPIDKDEPLRVAESIRSMQLKHCVITSVTRDDLKDGGASIWAETIREVKRLNPGVTIETLIPDMKGDIESINIVTKEKPDIISHNIETVKHLYPTVRPQANYLTSLQIIELINKADIRSKSGFMLGLGETEDEVKELISELNEYHLKILTIGQYLQPTRNLHPVVRYVPPDEFNMYKDYALKIGIKYVESAPLVRSSFHSENHLV